MSVKEFPKYGFDDHDVTNIEHNKYFINSVKIVLKNLQDILDAYEDMKGLLINANERCKVVSQLISDVESFIGMLKWELDKIEYVNGFKFENDLLKRVKNVKEQYEKDKKAVDEKMNQYFFENRYVFKTEIKF